MAGPILGMTGSVSWAVGTGGTSNKYLTSNTVTGGNPVSVTLALNADEFDVTAFNSTDAATAFLKGLQSWSGEFEALMPGLAGPELGNNGSVTFPNGYTSNIAEYELNIERPALDSTVFATAPKTYLPGLHSWSGRFSGFYDDTAVAVFPGHLNEPATLTLQYSERGANDAKISGTAFTTLADISATSGALNTIAYTFRGSGPVTHSTITAGGSILDPTGAPLVHDTDGVITILASTGQQFQGSAFWTRIGITVPTAGVMRARIGFQGTGALTIT
jgi:hypothetical protein